MMQTQVVDEKIVRNNVKVSDSRKMKLKLSDKSKKEVSMKIDNAPANEKMKELLNKIQVMKEEIKKKKVTVKKKKKTDVKSSKEIEKNKSKKEEELEVNLKTLYKKNEKLKLYDNVKKKLIENLNSLDKLYGDNVISKEEYERSKAYLKRKLEIVDSIILNEVRKAELLRIKESVEDYIKEEMKRGIFYNEENKLTRDLEALKKLYSEGLITEADFKQKSEEIKKKLEENEAIMNAPIKAMEEYVERITKETERLEKELAELDKSKKKSVSSKELEVKEKTSYGLLGKIFHRKRSNDHNEDDESTRAFEELKKIYSEKKGADAVGDMAIVVKREVERRLGIEEELTHNEIAEVLRKTSGIDRDVREKLAEFFERMASKEYLGKISEDDVYTIYEECQALLTMIVKKLKKREKEGKEKKGRDEETKSEEAEKAESEEEEIVEKIEKVEEKRKEKRGLLQKINDFFGV